MCNLDALEMQIITKLFPVKNYVFFPWGLRYEKNAPIIIGGITIKRNNLIPVNAIKNFACFENFYL